MVAVTMGTTVEAYPSRRQSAQAPSQAGSPSGQAAPQGNQTPPQGAQPSERRPGGTGPAAPQAPGTAPGRGPGQPEPPPPFVTSLWSITLPGSPSAAPAFDETQVYVPLKDGQLLAASVDDGHTLWIREAPTTAGLATGDDLVFVAGNDAIAAFSRTDGAPRWSTPITANLSAPMLWDTGWLFVATEGAEILAIRAADGVVLWRQGVGSIIRARPAPAEERVYVSLEDGNVMALSLKDGTPVWQRKLADTPVDGLALTDRIFVGSKDNFFYCLDAQSGNVKWRWRTGADLIGAPVVDDARVYFVSLDNVLRALDSNNGSLKWQRGLTFRPSGGPIRVRDLLVVSGVSTSMYAFQAKNGKPAGEYTAPADLDAPPHFIDESQDAPVIFVILTRDGRLEALQRSPDIPPIPSHAPSQVLGAPIVSTEPIDGLPLADDAPVEEETPPDTPPE